MVKIIDTTLREGEQAPGVTFTCSTKKTIITGLASLKIDEIEIGIAARKNKDLPRLCRFIHSTLPEQRFSLWCRCREEDILFAATLQPSILALSIPASDLHLQKKLGKDRNWAIQTLQKAIGTAIKAGIRHISIGLEDASRADIHFVRQLAQTAENAGAFRLRLADTVGIAAPPQIIDLLSNLKETTMEIGLHCHNDFGMATANTITGLANGAEWADVTLLGLGERAGNSRLEEVLSYLVFQEKITKYKLEELRTLSTFTAEQSARKISPCRPILGADIFTCETGIHQQGILADPSTYEPYRPEQIGHCRKIRIGSKSGRRSIAATLNRLGFPNLEAPHLNRLTEIIRNQSKKYNRPLEDNEIAGLAAML